MDSEINLITGGFAPKQKKTSYIRETYIDKVEIRSPTISGNEGFFSTIFKVGIDGIVIDGLDKTISSDNYIEGQSGWIIKNNGDAEFQDGIFRGQIDATGGKISGTLSIDGGELITGDPLENDNYLKIEAGRIRFNSGGSQSGYMRANDDNIGIYGDVKFGGDIVSSLNLTNYSDLRLYSKSEGGTVSSGEIKGHYDNEGVLTKGTIRFNDNGWKITGGAYIGGLNVGTQGSIDFGSKTLETGTSETRDILYWNGEEITQGGLKLSGGTMSGSIDMGSNSIHNINQVIVSNTVKPSSDKGADLGTSATGFQNGFIDDLYVEDIHIGGHILPDTDEGSDLGTSTKGFNDLHIDTIYATDDELDIRSDVDLNNNTLRRVLLDLNSSHTEVDVYVATTSGGSATSKLSVIPIKVDGTTRYLLSLT